MAQVLENPYYDEWFRVTRGGKSIDSLLALSSFTERIEAFERRPELCVKYAWAVPSEEALAALLALGPIVEVGAGKGYWAKLLRERGGDVIAYDKDPRQSQWVDRGEPWSEVLIGDEAAAAAHFERALFLCWPPYDTPFAARALDAYLGSGGRRVAYLGEGTGGCTGDDAFHERLGTLGKPRLVKVPQWPGIHDRLEIYEAPERPARGGKTRRLRMELRLDADRIIDHWRTTMIEQAMANDWPQKCERCGTEGPVYKISDIPLCRKCAEEGTPRATRRDMQHEARNRCTRKRKDRRKFSRK